MNEFLNSLKADLLDRRLLPLAGLALAALIAALAYVALGGGSGSSTPSAPVAPALPAGASGISVSAADPSAAKAVAETTDGFKQQRKGGSRNPFAPLAGAASSSSSTSKSAPAANSGASGSGSSGSANESKGEEKKETSKEPAKPKTIYHVTVKFGSLAPNPVTGEVALESFVNLKLFTPLPNRKQPLLVFRGVTAGGKAATFTVVGEAILNGNGTCLPSAFQCGALDLKPGQSEKLEYLAPGASTVVAYELRVVSISPVKASTSSAHSARAGDAAQWGKSQAGWEYLYKAGLLAIPGLRQSSQTGVLVWAARRAAHAGAHISRHGPRLGR